ncbi:MBL fold metallo-hydrolase [Roseiterribacter gracilis]|uniref:MBL fold metallo-hydrolase n=1 Tax=Roseiterribacter gracilis TaxID=2812848 RepID=A0A8S8XK63_9PROT|nr:MBL fold metallo-hydrolase [Rhodospirillales bacterium TMPK1]
MSNSQVSRRTLLAGVATGLVAANLPLPALAASRIPTTTQQGAGFYRFKIGTFDAAVISDGVFELGAPAPLALNAKPAEVQRTLAAAGQPTDKVGLHCNSLLVDTGRELVLVDPGSGPHFGPALGKLVQNLRNAGVAPDAIDRVIVTHAHPDHIWGTVDAEFRAAFPKAQMHVPAVEVSFWTAPNVSLANSKFPPEQQQLFIGNTQKVLATWKDRIVTFKAGDEVVPGIRSIATPGHTPGHVSLRIDGGGGNQLVFTADVVHHHVTGLVHPDWTPLFDQDAEQAKTTRKKLLTSLTAEKARLLVYHFPFPGIGHVISAGAAGSFGWAPETWAWEPA